MKRKILILKSITMKTINFKKILFLPLLFLMLFSSCQDEVTEITEPTNEETITANSSLATLMRNTTSNDGSQDNILDYANCLEVELPVTVIIDGVEIIIDSEDDFDVIEEIFDEFDNDEDTLDFVFPITIISSDYTVIVIENEAALEELALECHDENEDDDDIECIDFQYPISISIYNTDFEVIDTITINDDEALYNFIENLEGGVLASLNFPITMVLANGDTVVVENNTELEAAIIDAEDDCDEDDDYDWNDDDIEDCDTNLDGLEAYLLECGLEAYILDNNNVVDVNYLMFDQGGVVIVNGTPAVTETATWSLSESNEGYVLAIDGLVTFNLVNGDWFLLGCERDEFIFTQEMNSGNVRTMELEQECNQNNQNLLDCYSLYILSQECDDNDDGIATFVFETNSNQSQACLDLYPLAMSSHATYEDAENNTNLLNISVTTPIDLESQTLYIRVYSETTNDYAIQELEIIVEPCNNNPFDCYASAVDQLVYTCIDSYGEPATFDLTRTFVECVDPTEHTLTYYTNVQDAENNSNAIASPEAYVLEGPYSQSEIYVRVETNGGQYEVFSIFLFVERCTDSCSGNDLNAYLLDCVWDTNSNAGFVLDFNSGEELVAELNGSSQTGVWDMYYEFIGSTNTQFTFFIVSGFTGDFETLNGTYEVMDCDGDRITVIDADGGGVPFTVMEQDCSGTGSGCSEQEVDAFLIECTWNVVNYNGSDDLVVYDFDFNSDNTVVIEGEGMSVVAIWVSSQTNEGVLIDFANVSLPNIQAISGAWLIEECAGDRLQFVNDSQDTFIMEQDCN